MKPEMKIETLTDIRGRARLVMSRGHVRKEVFLNACVILARRLAATAGEIHARRVERESQLGAEPRLFGLAAAEAVVWGHGHYVHEDGFDDGEVFELCADDAEGAFPLTRLSADVMALWRRLPTND